MKFCLRLPITSTNNNEPAKLAPRFATPTTSDLTILKPGRTHAKKDYGEGWADRPAEPDDHAADHGQRYWRQRD